MSDDFYNSMQQVNTLVDEYRKTCLWFLREDYYPETAEAAIRVLGYIEKHGDLAAFKKAATLRQWLSRESNSISAI